MADVNFEQLVDSHYAALYRFAFSLAKNEADAADLTQQTFFLWAAKGHELREAAKVKSWLFTTLYREFLGRRRHDARFPHEELQENVAENTVESSVVASLEAAEVVEALGRIEEIYRAPLALFWLNGLSYREIAEVLEIPIGTVMSRLSRGKAQLRELLSDASGKGRNKVIPIALPPKGQQQ